jgi:predicted acyltransferase
LQLAPKSFIEVVPVPPARRIASVDALRGFNIFWILGGDGAIWAFDDMSSGKGPVVSGIGHFLGFQLHHVPWEGFRFYDFIFPLFIFVTGVSIVFSLSRLVEREGLSRAHIRVLRRSLLLYGLGLIYYGGISHHWSENTDDADIVTGAEVFVEACRRLLAESAPGLRQRTMPH